MKKILKYALAVLLLFVGGLAVFFSMTAVWIVIAVVAAICCLCELAGSVKNYYQREVFSQSRLRGKEAVVRLQTTIHRYERDDVLADFTAAANCGAELSIALGNATRFAADMDEWLLMICGYFHRGCLPKHGLQIAQVEELADAVTSQLIGCYRWLREGRNGPRPAILASDWYDLETVFPGYKDLYGTNFRPGKSQTRQLVVVAQPVSVQLQLDAQTVPVIDQQNGAGWRRFFWLAQRFCHLVWAMVIRRRKPETQQLLTHQPERYPGTELLHDARSQRNEPVASPLKGEPPGGDNVVTSMEDWRLRRQLKAKV